MYSSDGTFPTARPTFTLGLSDFLLAAFDAPPTGDVDPTVDVGGGRVMRTRPARTRTVRPPRVRQLQRRVRPVQTRSYWGLAFGIASSASLLVMAMGVLSLVGVVALFLLA